MATPSARPRGILVRTACATEAEFIALVLRDCDEASLFIATQKDIAEGADVAFSLELADGQPMLRGLGVALDAWRTPDNPFGRVGVHVGFVQLTTTTEQVLDRILAARAAAGEVAVPRRRTTRTTHELWGGAFAADSDDDQNANPGLDDSVIADVRRTITRELAATTPPADVAAVPDVVADSKVNATTRYDGPLRAPALPSPRLASAWPPPPTVIAASQTAPWWRNARVGGVFACGILVGVLFSLLARSPSMLSSPATTAGRVALAQAAECAVSDTEVVAAQPQKDAPVVAAAEPSKATPVEVTHPARGPAKRKIAPPAAAAQAIANKAVPATTGSRPSATTRTKPVTNQAATRPSTTTAVTRATTNRAVATASTSRPAPAATATKATTSRAVAAASTSRVMPAPTASKATTNRAVATTSRQAPTATATKPMTSGGVATTSRPAPARSGTRVTTNQATATKIAASRPAPSATAAKSAPTTSVTKSATTPNRAITAKTAASATATASRPVRATTSSRTAPATVAAKPATIATKAATDTSRAAAATKAAKSARDQARAERDRAEAGSPSPVHEARGSCSQAIGRRVDEGRRTTARSAPQV